MAGTNRKDDLRELLNNLESISDEILSTGDLNDKIR